MKIHKARPQLLKVTIISKREKRKAKYIHLYIVEVKRKVITLQGRHGNSGNAYIKHNNSSEYNQQEVSEY